MDTHAHIHTNIRTYASGEMYSYIAGSYMFTHTHINTHARMYSRPT
jgi:hypothetical protein